MFSYYPYIPFHLNISQSAAVLKTATGEKEMDFRGHENVVEIAIFAPSRVYPALRQLAGLPDSIAKEKEPAGLFAATASRDKSIKLWDSKTGSCIKTLVSYPYLILRSSLIPPLLRSGMTIGFTHSYFIRLHLTFYPPLMMAPFECGT
jgi:WD40 repeat protein